MKKVLALLLVVAMSVTLFGCSGGKDNTKKDDNNNDKVVDDKGTDQGDGEQQILKLLENENIPSLVTWKSTDAVSFEILGNILSGLYTLGEGGVPVPDMAESVDVSEDGLTYTFKLREGAKWVTVDGEEYADVTADDFVFAWKKALDPAEASQYAFMISTASIKNGKEAVALNEQLVGLKMKKDELAGLSVDQYEASEEQTAEEQFNEAKESLEKTIAETEATVTETYGSIDEAYAELDNLINNLAVTAEDPYTLKVELSNPVPYFIDLMTFATFYPANEAFYNEVGAEAYGTSVDKFLYNGPYIFKDWKISERHYIEKNPKHWDAENVGLYGVDWRVIEGGSNDTAVQMYLDGETQYSGLQGENVEKYGNRPDTVSIGETVLFYLELNQGKGEPTPEKKLLADARARRAINMAIDKSYITDVIYKNGSIPADFFVPKGFVSSAAFDGKGFREVAGDLFGGADGYNKYNADEAKKLWDAAVADAGMSNVTFDLIIYQGDEAAQVGTHIKNELEKNLTNLTINVQALPFSEKLARSDRGEYELNWSGWGPDYPDAMTFMDMWVTGGGHNATGYSNPDYDAVIDNAKSGELTAPNKAKERFESLVELEKVLLEEDQVIVPLYQRAQLRLKDPKVKNLWHQSFGPDYIYKWVTIEE